MARRLKNHKSKAKEEGRQSTPLYFHFNSLGWNTLDIVIVIEREFESIHHLRMCEKEEILKWKSDGRCLNHSVPYITKEEEKQADRDYSKKRRDNNYALEYTRLAQWRKNNPEKYGEQLRRSVENQRRKRMEAKNNLENNTN